MPKTGQAPEARRQRAVDKMERDGVLSKVKTGSPGRYTPGLFDSSSDRSRMEAALGSDSGSMATQGARAQDKEARTKYGPKTLAMQEKLSEAIFGKKKK